MVLVVYSYITSQFTLTGIKLLCTSCGFCESGIWSENTELGCLYFMQSRDTNISRCFKHLETVNIWNLLHSNSCIWTKIWVKSCLFVRACDFSVCLCFPHGIATSGSLDFYHAIQDTSSSFSVKKQTLQSFFF